MKHALLIGFLATTCALPGLAQDKILWGDQHVDRISSANANDLGSISIFNTTTNPTGVAYYHGNTENPLFFATSTTIEKGDLSGRKTPIVTTTGLIRGVAVDFVGKKVYWTNENLGTIGRADFDGSGQELEWITGLSNPFDIEIDPLNQKVYWSEPGSTGGISRVNFDGSNLERVVDVSGCYGFAVDYLRNRIYFMASGGMTFRASLDDPTDLELITGLDTHSDIDVDVTTGVLYTTSHSGTLTRAHSDGTGRTSISAFPHFVALADMTAPVVSSVSRHDPSTTVLSENSAATFRVSFSEPVMNVDASDFQIDGTATGSISINPVSLYQIYDVVIRDLSGMGALGLRIASAHDILDFGGNAFTGTISAAEEYCIPPAEPLISMYGDVLTSSATEHNQWSLDNVAIPDATNRTYTALQSGEYAVTVSNGSCSTTSDPMVVTEEMLTPSITSFDPTSGTPGTPVVITGSLFGEDNVVSFNGVVAEVTARSKTGITAVVPMSAGTGPITVTSNGRSGESETDFTYVCVDPPKPVITHEGGLLASSSDTNNQWLRNGVEIPDATSQTYAAAGPGSYTVSVYDHACFSESDPATIVALEESLSSVVQVYPNPVHDQFTVSFGAPALSATVHIYTLTGREQDMRVLRPHDGPVADFNIRHYPKGLYVVVITTPGGRLIRKLRKI